MVEFVYGIKRRTFLSKKKTKNVEFWEWECQSCCLWWWYTIKEQDTLKNNGSIVDVFAASSRPTYYPTSEVLTPTSKFKST